MSVIHNPESCRSGRERQLDYKKAFQYWLELGTLRKATLAMERDGYRIVMKDGTIKPFSRYTIRRAAWIWVIENPDAALAVWQKFGAFHCQENSHPHPST
jgi:hypothetical protein